MTDCKSTESVSTVNKGHQVSHECSLESVISLLGCHALVCNEITHSQQHLVSHYFWAYRGMMYHDFVLLKMVIDLIGVDVDISEV